LNTIKLRLAGLVYILMLMPPVSYCVVHTFVWWLQCVHYGTLIKRKSQKSIKCRNCKGHEL